MASCQPNKLREVLRSKEMVDKIGEFLITIVAAKMIYCFQNWRPILFSMVNQMVHTGNLSNYLKFRYKIAIFKSSRALVKTLIYTNCN